MTNTPATAPSPLPKLGARRIVLRAAKLRAGQAFLLPGSPGACSRTVATVQRVAPHGVGIEIAYRMQYFKGSLVLSLTDPVEVLSYQ